MTDKDIAHPQEGGTGKRLSEILSVLRKRGITKGLTPAKLREIFEDLGPTYVKIGQIMSMRSDLLPEDYCRELAKLRSDAAEMPFDTVLEIIEKELGRPAEEIFASIEKTPLGSASIAQAHSAVLADGRKAVIKVQRPNIHAVMENDIRILRKASGLLKLTMGTGDLVDFRSVIEEIWKTSQEEMDFKKESDNLIRFRKNQEGIAYVTSPVVYAEYTTAYVLTMSDVGGVPIDGRQELEKMGYDLEEIASRLAENYCRQILHDGFFHADPHPGNLKITDGKIAWIDLGMTGTVSENLRHIIKIAVEAVINDDIYSLTNAFLSVGKPEGEVDRSRLYSQIDSFVRRYKAMDFGSMDIAEMFEDGINIIKSNRIAIPSELTILYRSMLTIEGTLALISSRVNLLKILTDYLKNESKKEFDLKKELLHDGRLIYASTKKTMEIPAQISDLLSLAKNGDIMVGVHSANQEEHTAAILAASSDIAFSILILSFYLLAGLTAGLTLKPEVCGLPWLSFLALAAGSVLLAIFLIRLFRRKKKTG